MLKYCYFCDILLSWETCKHEKQMRPYSSLSQRS